MAGLLDIAGLLDYVGDRLPKPRGEEVEDLKRRLKKLRSGEQGYVYGLLGPNDAELSRLRDQRGITYAEPPSPWVSLGRGATDLWEPVKQSYLNLTDSAQADAYRQQRAEDEQRYQRGVQWANPQPGYVPQRDDFWRMQGQQLPFLLGSVVAPAASASLPQTAVGYMGTQNLYDVLNAIRKRFGVGE
jgi:hypothetical protein